jgi:RNA polymerase sigma-70 factor (ECF subfamily)
MLATVADPPSRRSAPGATIAPQDLVTRLRTLMTIETGQRGGAAAAGDEADLMARVASGGADAEHALRELYQRYSERVFGLGVLMLKDRELAAELVQETFVRLWRVAATFDPQRGSMAAFAFTIARRLALDLRRRPSLRPFEPQPEVEEEADSGDPLDTVLIGLTVRDALQALSEPHRQVLELSYRGDLKQTEIAAMLGIPLGTVKTRSYYALRALKLALEERGVHA